ncbi:MAG: C40 family peptidase [Sediminibacterium sp.]|jgi:hypothetical protein
MRTQILNRNVQLLVLVTFLSSCSTLKNISFPLNKGKQEDKSEIKKLPRTMEFLEDISVTPGRITINNASNGLETEKPTIVDKNYELMPENLSDIEKANWLQIKYSLKMDIAVEEIKNIPLLQKIDEWWGTPYVLGGSSKNGVDCSFFTLDVMRDIYKVNLKRTAAEQYDQSVKIEWNNLREGDLIFFKTEGRRRISHVGIYLANNKFAHASTSQGVTIGDLTDPYWQKRLYSLGRINP